MTINSYDQLPVAMSANHVASALGVSKVTAYNLMHREDFPTILIGKRMVVPKDKFILWVDNQISNGSVIS